MGSVLLYIDAKSDDYTELAGNVERKYEVLGKYGCLTPENCESSEREGYGVEVALRSCRHRGVFQRLSWFVSERQRPSVEVVLMARVVLALYLMFAGAAGPWLCSCTVYRLLGRLSDSNRSQMTGSRCCNHRATGGVRHVPGNEQHPRTPTPHDPCPCQDGVPDSVAILGANSQAASARLVALSPEFSPGVFDTTDLLTWHPPAVNGAAAFAPPVQNPRDILSILQTLRC